MANWRREGGREGEREDKAYLILLHDSMPSIH